MTIVWILIGALAILALGLFIATVVVYEKYFTRFETPELFRRSLDEFPGLEARPFTVVSDRGQKLAAYAYRHPETKPRAVLVVAHGLGGGGHNTYLDVIDYFARRGFIAIGYDVTGNDASEGKSCRGLPQGPIDLAHVLRHVKADPELAAYPLALFGHSWGGYSVGAVLNFEPDVDAVVSVAGFNDTPGIIRHFGRQMVGPRLIAWALPFFKLYEWMKFGKRARATASDGYARSQARVLILHSRDDDVVPARLGYDIYKEKFGENPRFKFALLNGKGHGHVYYTREAKAYFDAFFKDYEARFKRQKASEDAKKAYLREHFDLAAAQAPDNAVLSKIMTFYESSLFEK